MMRLCVTRWLRNTHPKYPRSLTGYYLPENILLIDITVKALSICDLINPIQYYVNVADLNVWLDHRWSLQHRDLLGNKSCLYVMFNISLFPFIRRCLFHEGQRPQMTDRKHGGHSRVTDKFTDGCSTFRGNKQCLKWFVGCYRVLFFPFKPTVPLCIFITTVGLSSTVR